MTNPQFLQRPQRGQGGGRPNPGNRRGNGHPEPSPWLLDHQPQPAPAASFVEYLRWMRAPGSPHRDGTKVRIVEMAVQRANYQARLRQMEQRTRRLAHLTVTVRCPWRIRVGGTKGPESMLLPAFDHLGIPYIPSSTLRGVARAQGMRELLSRGLSRPEAEAAIAQYFGDLDAPDEHKAGKVIFLDAYPLPRQPGGGLAADIANNLWKWEGQHLHYSPNPNIFFSLEKAEFLVGLRRGVQCSDALVNQVKEWLLRGLAAGIGSQVNAGYGRLVGQSAVTNAREFLRLPFTLEGQLIHGAPTVTWQQNGYNNRAIAEVRPVAFKNLLRYWFRALALGVWPALTVQEWEALLFGSISPRPTQGWLRVEILDGRVTQREAKKNSDPVGQQKGIWVLSLSEACPEAQKDAAQKLFRNLTWLMFHLGGAGQGARRPCYSRRNRERPPWWRGSQLIPESQDQFWALPDTAQEFAQLLRRRIQEFFAALRQVSGRSDINPRNPRRCGQVTAQHWHEAIDAHCRIVIAEGQPVGSKPYALAQLHQIGRRGQGYDPNLCGSGGRPSPVWIADFDGYQTVVVFGATANPRQNYLDQLKKHPVWPLS